MNNTLTELLGKSLPPSLKWLTLTSNRIKKLPRDLCIRAPKLQKLMLSHNDLETVDLRYCLELEEVRLAGNRLSIEASGSLPHLPKLTWVSLSGNWDAELPVTETSQIKYEEVVLDNMLDSWDA